MPRLAQSRIQAHPMSARESQSTGCFAASLTNWIYRRACKLGRIAPLVICIACTGVTHAQELSSSQSPPSLADHNQHTSKTSEKSDAVKDLLYGTSLFHFYQGDYFNALTELKVGQKRQQLPHHGAQARLLEGGISLAWNMDNSAQQIFNELLADHLNPEEQARAWFYLGKLQFQRGEYEDARTAFQQLHSDDIEDELADEAHYLSARSALQYAPRSDANAIADNIDRSWPWALYYQLNRALASPSARSVVELDELATMINKVSPDSAADKKEAWELQNRARLLAGLLLLKDKRYSEAVNRLKAVDYRSSSAEEALLAWGWTSLSVEDYRDALTPFTYLTGFFSADPHIAESYLMVGKIYQKLEKPDHAITAYSKALKHYTKELAHITTILTQLDHSDLQTLYDIKLTNNDSWFTPADTVPDNPNTAYLRPLFQSQAFQHLIKHWQDLNKLEHNLETALTREETLDYVLASQQVHFDALVKTDRLATFEAQLSDLQQLHADVSERIKDATSENDGLALMPKNEKKHWERIQSATQNAHSLKSSGKAKDRHFEKLAFYQGLMMWNADEQFTERNWQQQKSQTQLSTLVRETEQQMQRVKNVSNSTHREGIRQQLTQIQHSTRTGLADVATVKHRVETDIKQQARERLINQQRRIEDYRLDAQLAIAQIRDGVLFDEHEIEP